MKTSVHKYKYFLLGFISFITILFYAQTFKLPKAGYQLPRLLSFFILILVLIEILQIVFIKNLKNTDIEKEKKLSKNIKINIMKTVSFILITISYVILINTIGYFIMTPIYLFTVFIIFRSIKLSVNIIVTAVFTLFVYGLFVRILHLPVPMGFLG